MAAAFEQDLGRTLAVIAMVACLCACAPERESPSGEPASAGRKEGLLVYSVHYPLAYFAERIGGEQVESVYPGPVEGDPAGWSPEPDQVAAFQMADLILLNGAGYAGWLDRASLLRRKQVDTSTTIRDRLIRRGEGVIHTHGPEGEHSDRGMAFTTWLDPELAREQARAIAGAFRDARPDGDAYFTKNLESLERDLARLDARLVRVAEELGDRPLLFSHPVYAYLERRYGLNGRSLHWEPDEPPSEAMWHELAAILAGHRAEVLIWEGPPNGATRARLEELGLRSVVYAPCATPPDEGNWLSVMDANVRALESLLLEDVESD